MLTLAIDGNHLAHRCRHVFSLSNRGVDVSITYGFIRVMDSLINKYHPSSILVGWDGGIPEFRRAAVPEYKANRHKDDDPFSYEDFLRQVRELSDYALPMMGVLSVYKPGAEADDIIYHASRILAGEIIIVTGDKDLLQACNERVRVLNPTRDILYDRERVEKEYDVTFSNFIDWRALQGDSSDNIPGVTGIGEKTASKLFREWGTLTGIYNAALGHNPNGRLTGTVATNIINFGLERIARNVYVTALYNDRVGARSAILRVIRSYCEADPARIKKYLMTNAFVSLIGSPFTRNVMKLSRPKLKKGIRIPAIAGKRYPVL